jgi:hypothetical protein
MRICMGRDEGVHDYLRTNIGQATPGGGDRYGCGIRCQTTLFETGDADRTCGRTRP